MRAPDHPLIVIAGSIGVGKTTLATVIQEHFGIPAWIERADRNPYLGGLYEDPARWAYPAHEVFLDLALERQREAGRAGGPAVVDRSPHETVHVFATMLGEMGHIGAQELAALSERLDAAAANLVGPSSLLYLHAPVGELQARIQARAWEEERGISAEYLTALETSYERFARNWSDSPVLDVDTSAVDVRVPANVERLLEAAGAALPD